MTQQFHSRIYIQRGKKQKHKFENIHTHQWSQQHYLQLPRHGNKCPSAHEWMKKLWYTYTMGYYSAMKRQIFEICSNMDEPGGYDAK